MSGRAACLRPANGKSQTSSPTPNLPTRLPHIELKNGGEYKLNLSEGATLPQSTLYLTLSHCWGDKPISGLLTRNLERFKQDIEFESLPKTFQHAIIVTRDLGYSYLWIDSLCIIQNCKEDWLKEGPQMGEIYQNAVCNIAASGFKDSHAGLFVSRNVDTLLPLKIDVRWPDLLGSSECHIMEEESWDSVENAHLNSRGWVFQERILSTRIIHFGIRQLFWQSCTTSGNEQWPNGLPFEADGVIMGDLLKENWESLKDPIGILLWHNT